MVNPNSVLEWIWYALNNSFGYIWGTCWIMWTEAKQKAATREATVKYGSRWIGHMVCDCANLLRGAFKKAGCDKFHAGSNLIWECDLSAKGSLTNGVRSDGNELLPCTAVFTGDTYAKHDHVGMYVGDGEVIEAAGTQQGVIKSKITDKKWKWWGEIKYVDYSGCEPEPTPEPTPEPDPGVKLPTLRKGDSGQYVTLLQTKLIQRGYSCGSCGADGKFGNDTIYAVRKFQAENGLQPDGVVGAKTWEALNANQTVLYAVTVPHLTLYQADALIQRYPGSWKNEEK